MIKVVMFDYTINYYAKTQIIIFRTCYSAALHFLLRKMNGLILV